MNVLHIFSGREVGGIRSYILSITDELRKKDVELFFVVMKRGRLYDDLRAKGLQVFVVKKRFRLDLTVVIRLVRIIKEKRVDIIHTHNVTSNFYGRLAHILSGRPVVTTVHANVFEEHKSSLGSEAIGRLVAKLDLYMARFSNRLITVASHLRDMLIEHGVDAQKVVLVRTGLAVDKADPKLSGDARSLMKAFGIDDDECVVGIVGRLVPIKNHRMFIDAAKEVIERGWRVKFLIVGDGMLHDELRDYTHSLGLTEKVVFAGWREDMELIYLIMNIFVISSTSEGFSIAPLEAMKHAVPIIATRVGGLPEIVKDGETGILVESDDAHALAEAIVYLLKNPEKRKEMGLAGRRLLEEFLTADKMAGHIYSIYISVISEQERREV